MTAKNWSVIHARTHQILRSRQLLAARQRVLIAVSGGQDSMGLLKLLVDLRRLWHWELGVIHCNHGWRSDAGANAQFVAQWADRYGLPFFLCPYQASRLEESNGVDLTKQSSSEQPDLTEQANPTEPPQDIQSEAKARRWRYQQFLHVATAHHYAAVVTGHTASDRAETLLYNLMRGSGLDGLGALQWQRSLRDPALSPETISPITLVRPLLHLHREELTQFCQDFDLAIWEDSTNSDRQYARNRIRLDLLPQLEAQFNPKVVQHLAQTAELIQGDLDYLDQITQDYQTQIQSDRCLQRSPLRSLPVALQRRIIRQFLRDALPHAPNFQHIEKVVHLIDAPQGTQTDPLPGGGIAQVNGDQIELMPRPNPIKMSC